MQEKRYETINVGHHWDLKGELFYNHPFSRSWRKTSTFPYKTMNTTNRARTNNLLFSRHVYCRNIL